MRNFYIIILIITISSGAQVFSQRYPDEPVASTDRHMEAHAKTPPPTTFGRIRSPVAPKRDSQKQAIRPPTVPEDSATIPAPISANRSWNPVGSVTGTSPPKPSQVGSTSPRGHDSSNVRIDAHILQSRASQPGIVQAPIPDVNPIPQPSLVTPDLGIGSQSISLQAALYGAITGNPDLVTLRQGNAIAPSPEAVEVARNFPTTLNPTLWIDYRPITLIPNGTFGSGAPGGHSGLPGANNFYHYGQNYIYVSLRQPFELGHQTTHRYRIAKAAYEQQKWIVIQAELTALVQTYRFFETAAYRREKFQLAQELADFNDHLLATLQRRMEANPALAADVSLARVESRAARQQIKAARQDYLIALADLRTQIGVPEQAGAIEPLGEFELPPYIPPLDEQAMLQEALQNRPDVRAASAQVAGTHSAVDLARGDRIPTPIVGPQYAMDEAGVQYVGLVLIAPIPVWNNGKPLVLQREAEHRRAVVAFEQVQQRAVAQIRAAIAKWNGARELVNESTDLSTDLRKEVVVLDRLFEAGQTDLTKLMQARQRLIQLENSRLDAVWQATQAQADLLLALGIPSLINSMLERAEKDATTAPAPRAASESKPNTVPVKPSTARVAPTASAEVNHQ
jgi:outer membrane protein, heavy metal efflux system